jgi:glutamyl-tRNA reductase
VSQDDALRPLSPDELAAETGAALPDKEVISLLDLNVDADIALDAAAPIDLAVAANANVAAPIDAAVAANVLSTGSSAQALADQGVTTIFIANRHADRARALAARFGGTVGSLEELPSRLLEADIVVASTASPHSLIGADDIELVMEQRRRRPLVLIDIAVPRDIEPECGDVEGVALYDIDDLQAVVARNLEVRASERARAEEVVEEEIQRFARWMAQLDVVPTIAALREHGAEIVDQVLAENSGRWESASARDLARIEAVARAVMQRLLHEPTLRLKAGDEAYEHLHALRELFDLEPELREPRPVLAYCHSSAPFRQS